MKCACRSRPAPAVTYKHARLRGRVAELSRRQLEFSQVFTVVSVAVLVSMAALLVKLSTDRIKPGATKVMPCMYVSLHWACCLWTWRP